MATVEQNLLAGVSKLLLKSGSYSFINNGEAYRLAVECDGHDFHERTKEQAARDRSRDRELQDAGVTIYRFTGSEIHNDPIGCAWRAIQWCERAAYSSKAKAA